VWQCLREQVCCNVWNNAMLEPGLVDSACQCLGTHCFVNAAIFDCWKHRYTSHHPSLPDLAHVIFSFLRMKSQLWGCHFQNSGMVHDHPTCYSNKLLAVLSAVAEMVDPLCRIMRWWRWWITKVCMYFVIDSFWEFQNVPSYFKNAKFGQLDCAHVHQVSSKH
jgi:hypothetical protein